MIRAAFPAQEDVGDDIEVLAECEILEHRRDPEVERGAGIRQRDLLPVELDHTGCGLVDPGEDLDQRRLARAVRSEEHTSELQSRQYLVCRLLLEKKKKVPSREYT